MSYVIMFLWEGDGSGSLRRGDGLVVMVMRCSGLLVFLYFGLCLFTLSIKVFCKANGVLSLILN